MDVDDSRASGSPPDDEGKQLGGGADRLSRRQALHRLGLGVAGGAAAWAAPEILIGRPTAAGAASDAPEGGGVRQTGSGHSSAGQSSAGQSSAGGSVSGAAAPAPATGQAGAVTGSSASPADASPSDGGGGQLAFTGFNAERAVELGTGLLVGGWMLTRWSGRRDGDATDDSSAGRPPQPS
jgi:hypothetical protein